ncbi:MAG TPA: radical SAM protein [Armatimonadota bacterium]|nr:radical SAM protein [Armatimonadota bacterium]
MRVKLILPALTAARSPFWRPIKYSLFPPLGLATLAAYLRDDDEVTIEDEHVEHLDLEDEPELVGIQVYITSARRAYEIADHYRRRGVHVALGGVHVTSLPEEAARHADTVFLGPGEDTWPRFLRDFRQRRPGRVYRSAVRSLAGQPPLRRDLIKRHLYLAPNSLVVSRGCPHACDFCYKESFFRGGRSFYTQTVDQALAEIERLPGRHLFFVDDNIFGCRSFAMGLFDGLRGMGRLWQAAGTVEAALDPELLAKAADSGLGSLFVGFETLSAANLREQHKSHNLNRDYQAAIRALHDAGVMVHGSFVFGMDEDDETVFERTVEWAITQGIEAATFHLLTPYPGTALHRRLAAQGRITTDNWELYDTRHAVYHPAKMSPQKLEAGYRRAYRDFYRWSSILRGARTRERWDQRVRHVAYAAGWKKCEPLWDLVVRAKRVCHFGPLLEAVLAARGRRAPQPAAVIPPVPAPRAGSAAPGSPRRSRRRGAAAFAGSAGAGAASRAGDGAGSRGGAPPRSSGARPR